MSIVRATSSNTFEQIAGEVEKSLPIGLVLPWAGSPEKIPSHLILLTGSVESPQLVSKLQYPVLFDVIGYTYGGSGDLFSLPPYKGRTPVGYDASQTEFNTLGKTGGAKTHTLTVAQMPSHNHPQIYDQSAGSEWGLGPHKILTQFTGTFEDRFIKSAGGGQAHNNIQPYITQYFVIIAKTGVSTQDVYDLDNEIQKLAKRGGFIAGLCYMNSLPNFNSGKIKAPFSKVNGNTDLLTINSNNQIVIGSGISKVKVSYNIRYDWDNPLDKVYYAMLSSQNGDDWTTHGAVVQNYTIQYLTGYYNKIYNVSEGNIIQLLIGASEALSNTKAEYYIIVEIVE